MKGHANNKTRLENITKKNNDDKSNDYREFGLTGMWFCQFELSGIANNENSGYRELYPHTRDYLLPYRHPK